MHSILLCLNINASFILQSGNFLGSQSQVTISEEFLGGNEEAQIFLCSVASLQEEDLIKQSLKARVFALY